MPHRSTCRFRRRVCAGVAAVAVLGTVIAGAPAGSAAADRPTADRARVQLVRDGAGRVRLLAGSGARVPGLAAGVPAVAAARAHLARVGPVFGVAARDLRSAGTSRVAGRDVVRFQQTRDGLPVLGGQLVAVLDDHGGLLSVSGETAGTRQPAGTDLSTAYDVAASTAERTARRAVAAGHRTTMGSLVAERPTRWLLDRSLLDPRAAPGLHPVWRVPVHSTLRPDLRDLVLVDARSGRVAMRVSEVASLDRVVCDDVRTRSFRCRSAGYDRVEGGPPTGVVDADQAFDLTGVTATWFADTLGVDLTALIGDDLGDGRRLRSTTNYCPPGSCPLDNAFWSGAQMVYGAGYTSADDVVAHELAHGVTQHTAGLVYWYQSGAINESMSDVFGELVDLADGVGDDAPELRWRLGEDLPATAGGATRDMADPPRFAQPDTTSSTLYDNARDYDDSGAVHTDSGVPNKTAYLITDGTAAEPDGVFHGRSFAGIGTARAATLYWATLQMLTPGSDFLDLAAALRQACTNLAFTAVECETVGSAVEATELTKWAGPTAPRLVSMTGGPGRVHLQWAPPTSTGTTALGSYVVSVSPAVHGEDFFTVEPAANDWVLQDLSPGVDYVVRLVAVSPEGTSPAVTRTLSGSAFTVTAPTSAPWGRRVRVTGALRNVPGAGLAGRRVRLMRRDAGSPAYDEVGTTLTAADGTFAFGWPARVGADWYLLYRGGATEVGGRGAHHVTTVRSRVSTSIDEPAPHAGGLVTLSGVVRPDRRPGRPEGVVALQRREPDGDWARVARAPVTDGHFVVSWQLPTARPTALRVRVPAQPDAGLAAGTSRVVTLNPMSR